MEHSSPTAGWLWMTAAQEDSYYGTDDEEEDWSHNNGYDPALYDSEGYCLDYTEPTPPTATRTTPRSLPGHTGAQRLNTQHTGLTK